jgi:uncharacterized membrane protein
MKKKEIKIRFNTMAGDSHLKWRILIDGIEHLASEIEVLVPSVTTRDLVEGVGEKWHITCQPDLIEWQGDKIILRDNRTLVSHKRHALKAITYRVYSSCITSLIATIVTGNTTLGVSIGTADFFVKIITYYIHERLWYHIPFGIKK